MKPAILFCLLAALVCATPASAKWKRLPSLDKKPIGMEMVFSGTTLHSSSGMQDASALIIGDPQKPARLAAGKCEAILKFAKQSVIQNVSFISDGIEGKVSLSASADGKGWTSLAHEIFTAADRLIKLDTGTAQGRYVRLQFELSKGGTIRGLQVIGADTDANYTVTQNSDGTGAPVNFAAGIGGGRLIYLSPELFGNRNNEALKSNLIEFPESDEKYRTAVYDFGQVRTLNEFASVHSPRPVRFAVYAFDALPEKEDWRGRLAFDPAAFDSSEPVARAEDQSGSGHLVAKPSKVVKARYVALRWEPDFNPPAFSAYSVSISGYGRVTYTGQGFTVTTDGDGNGGMTIVAEGNVDLKITIDAEGNVTVEGSSAGDGQGGATVQTSDGQSQEMSDSSEPFNFGGVFVGAPSATGAGFSTSASGSP